MFRSGPVSENRPFNFKYSIVVKNNTDKIEEIFIFEYPPQESPKIEFPILTNNHQDYIDAFLNFIQNAYEIDEKIRDLLNSINEEFAKYKNLVIK